MNEQLLKTSGVSVSSCRKKIRKTSEGGGIPPPLPPLYVRGLTLIFKPNNKETLGTSETSRAKMYDNQQSGKVMFTDPIFLEATMAMLFTKSWLKLSTNYDLQKFR